MASEAKKLSFSITGEIITQIAREHFYVSNDLSKALELLMAALETDQLSRYQRMAIALEILDGKSEIVGTYPDGDYHVANVAEPDKRFSLTDHFNDLANKLTQANKELNDLRVQYGIVADLLTDDQIHAANLAWLQTHPEPYQPLFEVARVSGGTLADILRDFKDDAKEPEVEPERKYADFGWLEPNGEYHAVDFAEHEQFAYDTIRKRGWWDEYDLSDYDGTYAHGDFLIQSKGWVRIHCPYGVLEVSRSDTRRLTKAQQNMLYDYFIERDSPNRAEKYLEE